MARPYATIGGDDGLKEYCPLYYKYFSNIYCLSCNQLLILDPLNFFEGLLTKLWFYSRGGAFSLMRVNELERLLAGLTNFKQENRRLLKFVTQNARMVISYNFLLAVNSSTDTDSNMKASKLLFLVGDYWKKDQVASIVLGKQGYERMIHLQRLCSINIFSLWYFQQNSQTVLLEQQALACVWPLQCTHMQLEN